ncbi:MAG: 50S ribosomal protein L31e [Candidatus Nanohaloarchaea archaeon]|nr:50S ribosomal protein L31e [Candidatus Nanohaloarchaea archaeon]
MADTEIHTVGLGEVRRVAPRNRASKAMKLLKEYVRRHSGVQTVSVSTAVNEALWADGAANPPNSIDVQVLVDDGTAHVELADIEFDLPEDEEEEEEPAAEELTDEELAEKNVDEVKDLVDTGAVDAQRALDVEYAGKNRKTLIDWLQDRLGDETDEAEEDTESVEDSDESEDEEGEAEDEESGDETYDLPDDVVETFEDGTIGDGKEAAKELGKQELEKLLNFEEAHQNRKGMKKWLRSNMN